MLRRPGVGTAAIALLVCLWTVAPAATQTAAKPRTFTQAELFTPTKIWNAHLTFAKDQWAAIQPKRGPRGPNDGDDWLQNADGKRNGWGAIQGIEFQYVHADLDFEGVKFPDVGVRFKGNGTFVHAQSTGKVPLKIDLNKYVKGQKIAGLSTINFHNSIQDTGWMNESLAYRLYRDAGVPAPRTSYVRVFLTVNGQQARRYLGLYTLVENVDTNFMEARLKASTGAILKPSTVNPFTDRGAIWEKYNQTYDPKTDLTEAEKARVMEFCQFVSRAKDPEFAARIGEYVDIPEFAKYFAVTVWLANPDSILERGQNYYVYLKPDTRRFIFIPWDQDDSFGGFARVLSRNYQTMDIYRPWVRNVTFLNRLSNVPAFRDAYLARMKEFGQTVFQPKRFAAGIGELAPAIRPAVADEPSRLVGFDRIAAGKTGIVPFATGRTASIMNQLQRPR